MKSLHDTTQDVIDMLQLPVKPPSINYCGEEKIVVTQEISNFDNNENMDFLERLERTKERLDQHLNNTQKILKKINKEMLKQSKQNPPDMIQHQIYLGIFLT